MVALETSGALQAIVPAMRDPFEEGVVLHQMMWLQRRRPELQQVHVQLACIGVGGAGELTLDAQRHHQRVVMFARQRGQACIALHRVECKRGRRASRSRKPAPGLPPDER